MILREMGVQEAKCKNFGEKARLFLATEQKRIRIY